METKKCAQCGQEKPIEDFSKSYKNFCKACVAENVKEKRKSIFASVRPQNTQTFHGESATQFIPHPRMTIATAVLQGLLASGCDKTNSVGFIAQRAVAYADALLNELSRENDKHAQ